MKKLLFGTVLLGLVCIVPLPTMAQVYDDVPLGPPPDAPPPYEFETPPDMMPLPYAEDVYATPYLDIDLFFWNNLWWRLWQNRWYCSYYYDRGWQYYAAVPSFYNNVGPRWRGYYGTRAWYGNSWGHDGIYRQRPSRNWQGWHNDRQWERRETWNRPNYQSRSRFQVQEPSQHRQQHYQQQRQPRVQQPRPQYQERVQRQQMFNPRRHTQFQTQQPRQFYQARPQMRERPRIQQRTYPGPQGRLRGGRT